MCTIELQRDRGIKGRNRNQIKAWCLDYQFMKINTLRKYIPIYSQTMAMSRWKMTLNLAPWRGFPYVYESVCRSTCNSNHTNPGTHSCHGNSKAYITSSLKNETTAGCEFLPTRQNITRTPNRPKKFVAFCITDRPNRHICCGCSRRPTRDFVTVGSKKSVPLIYDDNGESPISLNDACCSLRHDTKHLCRTAFPVRTTLI